jgi:hypothetical protein
MQLDIGQPHVARPLLCADHGMVAAFEIGNAGARISPSKKSA